MRSLALAALVLVAAGCSAWRAPPADWGALVTGAEGLDPQALAVERDRVMAAYSGTPTDGNRLRLAYLLSRPGTGFQDLEAGQALLNEIAPSSPYAPVRDLLRREIGLTAQLESARRIAALQASRLETTETELADQAGLRDELARARAECEALRVQLEDAHRQLGALKAIDSDLAEEDGPSAGGGG